jgi:hypothetical protein
VVEIGVYENQLDAEFLEPEPAGGALEAREDAVGRLGNLRPEDEHLGVLECVFQKIVLLRFPAGD